MSTFYTFFLEELIPIKILHHGNINSNTARSKLKVEKELAISFSTIDKKNLYILKNVNVKQY